VKGEGELAWYSSECWTLEGVEKKKEREGCEVGEGELLYPPGAVSVNI